MSLPHVAAAPLQTGRCSSRRNPATRRHLFVCRAVALASGAAAAVASANASVAAFSVPVVTTTSALSTSVAPARRPLEVSLLKPQPVRRQRIVRAAGVQKEVDGDAISKYLGAVAIQITAIGAFFAALDAAIAAVPDGIPDWAVFGLFFLMSIRSRIFSPLDNSRPDIGKASRGEATGGFGDRAMPSWTPPGIFFPIMWILIVAPLRAASSVLIWQQTGHLCDAVILALMLHLCIGDTWNTVNNVERRLGAAVPGVLCVWASALFAAYTYYQLVPEAGQLLLPTCLWLTVAAALVTDTWRINNGSNSEPLYPYKGPVTTEFWFAQTTAAK